MTYDPHNPHDPWRSDDGSWHGNPHHTGQWDGPPPYRDPYAVPSQASRSSADDLGQALQPMREVAELQKLLIQRDMWSTPPDPTDGMADLASVPAWCDPTQRLRRRAVDHATGAVLLGVVGLPLAWFLGGLTWGYYLPLAWAGWLALRALQFQAQYRRRVYNPMQTPLDHARAALECWHYSVDHRPESEGAGHWLWVGGSQGLVAILHLRADDPSHPLEVQDMRTRQWHPVPTVQGAVDLVLAWTREQLPGG